MNQTAVPAAATWRRAALLVTSLFFMWGLSYGLLDVLNKHFQEALHVTRARSGLLQAAYFGAYFVVALPAARFMERFGYKRGILAGLALYAGGALLFLPATAAGTFEYFLLALFVLACGLGCLETAANPYMTLLGAGDGGARRLNLAQSFNGLGAFLGPLIGGRLFFAGGGTSSAHVQGTYVAIAGIVLLLLVAFLLTPMPEPLEIEDVPRPAEAAPATARAANARTAPLAQPHFRGAVFAQFCYVAAQVGVNAYFLNFVTEHQSGASTASASYLLSVAMVAFLVGRFTGTALMTRFAPARLLTLYAVINTLLCVLVALAIPIVSVIALVAISFFMSIMFPTIFALGVRGLGPATKRGSSLLIMSIVGGALLPWCMGWIGDHASMALAYLLPAACFVVVAWYGAFGQRLRA
ncbi:MAG: symporter permease [Pseudomonadota bacterium]